MEGDMFMAAKEVQGLGIVDGVTVDTKIIKQLL
jgi:hypothetical protein